nr:hypothetical protein [Tanacetum cinerariifolium]
MSTPKFTKTHNLVTFLAKPTECEGFEQITDFLNASYVKYALTVNLTVYTSCIEQFWATAKVKNVNGDAQIQALVDKRSSTMTSAIIYLATNQKFNFSKYIFDNMVKHLDGGVKFLMYPRFVQFFLNNQVEGMDRHNAIFVISSHTKKVFANMKKEGKDFSGKVTSLFATMMVQDPEDIGKGSKISTDIHHTPIVTQPSTSLPQKKQKSRRKQRKEIKVPSPICEIPNEEGVPTTSNDLLPSGEDKMQLNELMILCTNLQKQVLDLEEAKTTQAKEIVGLKKRVKKLEHKRKSRTLGLKRLRKVGSARRVESSTEASLGDQEDASKQGRLIDNIDQDVEITLVDDIQGRMNEEDMFGVNDLGGDEVVVDVSASEKVEQSVKVVEKEDELTLAHTLIEIKAAKPKAITTTVKTITAVGTRPKEKGFVMQEPSETPLPKPIDSSQKPSQAKDKGKGKMVEPERPLKRKDQIIMDEERLEEENKSVELKRCLEITSEDDDDVAIEATPLSSKSPTIVNYKIYKGKKSYFKIIRADVNSQSYLTFGKMFKNFNREDLEVLWSIVKARFKKTKPIDDMDNMLFQTLKTMFEHHIEENIYKYQQRLQVDYEVEMSYDLLRLTRKKIIEGYVPE